MAFDKADHIARENGVVQVGFMSRCIRAYHFSAWYDIPRTELAVEEAARLLNPARKMDVARYHLAVRGLAMAKRDAATAMRCADLALAAVSTLGSPFFRVAWLVCGSSSFAFGGRGDVAERWLGDAWDESEGTYLIAYRATILLIRSYIALQNGERGRCHALLREALALGRAQGTDVFFRWVYEIKDAMLVEALRAGIDIPYVQELVLRFGVPPPTARVESWPWPVKIYCLGRFELEIQGKQPAFAAKAPRKMLGLLKALICLGGRNVPDYRLIDALWPGEEGDAARIAFGVAIHRLRKLLGKNEAIEFKDGRISLRPDIVWVDAFAFQRLAGEVHLRSNGDRDATIERALELYEGTLLPGDGEEAWSAAMRERLRAKFVHYVGQAAEKLETDGEWERAIALYLRGIDADELIESFYQGLMRCHRNLGHLAEGLSVYRRMRHIFSVTLGVGPSQQSEALRTLLLQSHQPVADT